jgi:tetratricopeptide (TPR) repeat protein
LTNFPDQLNDARRLLGAGQWTQAEAVYRRLLESAPHTPALWHDLGIVHLQAGRPEEAVASLQKAIELDPQGGAYHNNLGLAYRRLNRPAEALACFQRALKRTAPSPQLYNNLALALEDNGRTEEALAAFDEALKLHADYAAVHVGRSRLLLAGGRVEAAQAGLQRAIELEPRDAEAHYLLGVADYILGRLDDALARFERAMALRPDFAAARANRALVWLAQGDFERGWPEWEFRLACAGARVHDGAEPRWDGRSFAGRTLLLYPEQGLGDTLQFLRYVPLVARLGGTLKLGVQRPLIPLAAISGFDRWLVRPGDDVRCDAQCPLLSVPGTLAGMPREPFWDGPYLAADERLAAQWESRVRSIDGFKIGIAWAGRPDHAQDRFRSVHVREFAPLAGVRGIRLVSLQKGPPSAQIAGLPELRVIDWGHDLDLASGALMDTAAIIRHLDLVISVDTAVAHLAGGMGAPVWLLLQWSPDWRWPRAGDATGWYPSMRIFRQRKFNDWSETFGEVADALRLVVARSSA